MNILDNILRQKLQDIVTQYGHAVCDDPNWCETLLRELCPKYGREIHLLIGALTENVAADLIKLSKDTPKDVLLSKLAERLYDNLGLAPEFARWAVESWALALGVIEGTILTSNSPNNTPKIIDPKSLITGNRQWWEQWDSIWKRIFQKALSVAHEPNDNELASILELSYLDCSGFQANNLEPVRSLTLLQELDCRHTQISHLQPLWHLKKLRTLFWGNSQVSFEEMERFTKECPECEVIPALTAERKWWLQLDEQWQAIFKAAISISSEPSNSDLVEMVNLPHLDCCKQSISSCLEPLHQVTQLSGEGHKNPISSLEPLHQLTKLRTLRWNVSQVSIEEMEKFVIQCPQCDIGVTLADIKWWAKLDDEWKDIFKSTISICHEPDNSELAWIVHLEELDCHETPISDLKPLQHLTGLLKLSCWGTPITRLEPLQQLTHLRELNCGKTRIDSLAPLHNLTNLRTLNCWLTPIKMLEPLYFLHQLTELNCKQTKVSRPQIKAFKENVPECYVEHDDSFWFF